MGRQRYTLADLEARLSERLGPNEKFWGSAQERKDALNEAISVWQALTGEWTTSISIDGKSKHRGFYPVPKQIVSLTRVSLTGYDPNAASQAGDLIAHIIPNSDMVVDFDQGVWTYSAKYKQSVDWNILPSGGQEPYTYSWTFAPNGGGLTPLTSTDESPVTFIPEFGGPWTATCVVTDAAGTSYTATFPFTVRVAITGDATLSMSFQTTVQGGLYGMVLFSGMNFWTSDEGTYPGFNNPTLITDHQYALPKLITFLTGKTSGVNILIDGDASIPADPYTSTYSNRFRAYLGTLGHNISYTPVGGDYTSVGNINNYDLILDAGNAIIGATEGPLIDTFLSHGKSILVCYFYFTDPAYWHAYGVGFSGYQTNNSPGQNCYNIHTIPIINGSPFKLSGWSAVKLTTQTKSKPGTITFYQNDKGENSFAYYQVLY